MGARAYGGLTSLRRLNRDDRNRQCWVATATLVARTIEPRSIYDVRLTDEEIVARQQSREPAPK